MILPPLESSRYDELNGGGMNFEKCFQEPSRMRILLSRIHISILLSKTRVNFAYWRYFRTHISILLSKTRISILLTGDILGHIFCFLGHVFCLLEIF
ncbi:hypothetical protein RhiirC2_858357 [Rhizophagus irregularis]|uniref:Uncharacterized protein n=1 Tax=Rhizophagus irregularis TaxID=588596 RepID=A0A2N1M622_9GLOM|nr:hypothetical protein RhiirC2_858357 [Rhizophagus irregularis]